MSIIIMLNLQITDTFVIYPAVVFLVSILFNMTDWLSSRFYEENIFSKLSETCYTSTNNDFDGKRSHFYNFLNANSF